MVEDIKISDYNYNLPDERIARYPLPQRDKSKLLVYRQGQIDTDEFSHLSQYLPAGALMVFNNTRVIQARLHFRKPTGALIEVFLLEPHLPAAYEEIFQSKGKCEWHCLVGNAKKWKEGSLRMEIPGMTGEGYFLEAELISEAKSGDRVGDAVNSAEGNAEKTNHEGLIVRLTWNHPTASFAEVLEAVGELPIPPYLNRQTEASDTVTYQTVYSKIKGSVAAPTAGLHFTPAVLSELDAKGIQREELTLHVGAGTFKPVKSTFISGHPMHTEHVCVKRSTIDLLLKHQGEAIAVGTTSVRTLESLYYMGVMVSEHPEISPERLHVTQWQPYHTSPTLTTVEALQQLALYMDCKQLSQLRASTAIMIAPGYQYHVVRMIITNFHQPQSTLLLLVSAFVGERWRDIYRYALDHDYRFLSYGDSSLLIP